MSEEWDLPTTWASIPLGQIADVQLGKMLSSKARTGCGSRPYIRNVNVRWHRIDVDDVLLMDFDTREAAKYALVQGDVLVCEGGEPGRAAVWSDQLRGAMYQKALHRVRFSGGALEARLFAYQLEHLSSSGMLASWFTGSTIKHLPREALLCVPVHVPPSNEQRRIVAALEEQLSNLNSAIAALKRSKSSLRHFHAAMLRDAVDGSIQAKRAAVRKVVRGPQPWSPSVPEEWGWAPLGDLSELVEYGTSTKTHITGDVPVLRMGNIVDGELKWDQLKFLPREHDEFPRLLLRNGDVLFNRTNSPELVGKTAVFRRTELMASFASYLLRVRLGPRLLPEFLSAFVNSPYGRAWIASVVSQQVGQANVNGSKLRELHVPIPPIEEQRALLAQLEDRLTNARRLSGEIDVQLARAAHLRNSILRHAFEGRLVAQDPKDETASVLVERVRYERMSATSVQQRKQQRRESGR